VLLCGGFVAFELACHTLSPQPGDYGEVYEAGAQSGPPSGGKTIDAATEDALGAEDDTGAPTCPTSATLFSNADNPQAITLDGVNAYWANAPAATGLGSIGTLPRASSGTATILVSGLTEPLYIANATGWVAWSSLGSVGLVNVSGGGGSATTPGADLVAAAGVAVDSADVYWVSGTTGVTVESAAVAGGGPNLLGTASGAFSAGGLSVQEGFLYFTVQANTGGGAIFQVSIGGGAPTALKTFATGTPSDVVTDETNVYWTDLSAGGGSVFSMPLGGGTITTMASSLGSPHHLAVDSTNVYTADSTGGSVFEIPLGSSGVTPKVLVSGTNPIGVAADDNQSVVYFTTATAICTIPK
jgi:hypothetical protein